MSFIKKIAAVCTAASALAVTGNQMPAMSAQSSAGGIVINEVCAKNTVFAAADGNFYDWIELYNSSSSGIDLSGFGLSDDAADPFRFTFPAGTVVGSGERILVFCDSKIPEISGQLTASFGLSTKGETITLVDGTGNAVDSVTFGEIDTNVSWARVPDGSDDLAFSADMTPGEPNSRQPAAVEVEKPSFSQPGGFYDSSFSLSLSVPQGTTVYYTLDGSEPTADSSVYTSPITVSDISSQENKLSARTDIAPQSQMSSVTPPRNRVDKAFIIRAAAMDKDGNFSETVTGSYFVGYQNKASYYKDLKVISLVTDSDNLYDYENGIYVLGKVYDDWKNGPEYDSSVPDWEIPANYTQKGALWEREASMEIFDGGSSVVSQNVGIRIHGGATRSMPQKSFNVYARSDYGTSKLDFDLFSGSVVGKGTGEKITQFDSFMLRNGGNDGMYTRFRDKLNQSLVGDRNVLTQGMEPCIVFIDGEYWGQYEITEKLDEDFVSAHYGIKKKNICIVKNQELDAGDAESFAQWEEMYEWIKTADLSDDKAYSELCEKIDIQSFMDYMSAEIYYNNCDWGSNNMAMWRSSKIDETNPYADGKWRFILFDTEYGADLYGQTGAEINSFSRIMKEECFLGELFTAAMKNDSFREQFSRTFMDMANENFDNDKVSALISQLSSDYHDTTIDTYNRFWCIWPGGFMAESSYSGEVNAVKSFYRDRFSSITGSLKSAFSLSGNLAKVTVKNNTSQGTVKINTLTPQFSGNSWDGKYYTDYPVLLSAKPARGYKFSCWETSDGRKITEAEASLPISGDITVTAVYVESDEMIGDVNTDGQVDLADVTALQKWLCKKGGSVSAYSSDVCYDGKINALDLTALKRIVAGK